MPTRVPARSLLLLASGILLSGASAGCDFFVEDPTPNQARILLSGAADQTAVLVMSRRFIAARQQSGAMTVELLSADTMVASPPFERTYDIRNQQQIFVRALAPADSTASEVQLRVFLDGALEYDETRNLKDGLLQFLYLFNRRILTDVQVL